MKRSDTLNHARRRWTRNPKKPRNPRKSSFQFETMEMNETVKIKLKDARVSMIKNKLKDAKFRWMLTMDWFQQVVETVESVEDGQLWNQKRSLNARTQSWLKIAARVKD